MFFGFFTSLVVVLTSGSVYSHLKIQNYDPSQKRMCSICVGYLTSIIFSRPIPLPAITSKSISTFSLVTGYKINLEKLTSFPYITKKQRERANMDTILFTVASKTIYKERI